MKTSFHILMIAHSNDIHIMKVIKKIYFGFQIEITLHKFKPTPLITAKNINYLRNNNFFE